ncbi:MAG: erythromycin esterase [Fimbriimonadaceae bacterium]|jgi:erythromycin esterase-like protein|nr:erythromycin esterase [Fimbriimonadaceae bacterium]
MKSTVFSGTDLLMEPIRAMAHTIEANDPLDPLFEAIGDARVVLLGEASHGTHEYYTWRSRISRRLILEKGFNFIAVEGDWPDCYEVNRYVKGWSSNNMAREVLKAFDRWPTWMWANWEIVALAEWMKRHNLTQPDDKKAGFYGLDVYSLWESLDALMHHLQEYHPTVVDEALRAMSCFEPFNREGQEYAWYTRLANHDCEDEVVELLLRLRSAPAAYPDDPAAHFNAEQNALVAVDAERYYRTMVQANDESWNVRDTHMMDTLNRLLEYHGPDSKAIVWEHNTHVGDARYTDMTDAGMVNIGQLARERYGDGSVFITGFGSYEGSVVASNRWGAPMEQMPVPRAREGSWEDILHAAQPSDQLMIMEDFRDIDGLKAPYGHRAIGVVYDPNMERYGNYVPTYITGRYDAFMFLQKTQALHPLHVSEDFSGDLPDTYPWGY